MMNGINRSRCHFDVMSKFSVSSLHYPLLVWTQPNKKITLKQHQIHTRKQKIQIHNNNNKKNDGWTILLYIFINLTKILNSCQYIWLRSNKLSYHVKLYYLIQQYTTACVRKCQSLHACYNLYVKRDFHKRAVNLAV